MIRIIIDSIAQVGAILGHTCAANTDQIKYIAGEPGIGKSRTVLEAVESSPELTGRVCYFKDPTNVSRFIDLAVQEEWTAAHRRTATALLAGYRDDAGDIAASVGARALRELIAAHELWCAWLGTGRVRKFALVAQRR